jgi:hypothetical protein
MDESTPNIDLAKAQKTAADLIAATFCSGATEAFLGAQAGLLKGAETVITEWLRRRKEAIADAHRLVARVRESRDVSDIWNAQLEWAAGARPRLATDVTLYSALFTADGWRVSETTKESVVEVTSRGSDALPKPTVARVSKNLAREVAKAPVSPASEEVRPH